MKSKPVKRPKRNNKLSIVLQKLEKQVDKAQSAPGTCIRVYCVPAL